MGDESIFKKAIMIHSNVFWKENVFRGPEVVEESDLCLKNRRLLSRRQEDKGR